MPGLLKSGLVRGRRLAGSLAQAMLQRNTNAVAGFPVSWKTRRRIFSKYFPGILLPPLTRQGCRTMLRCSAARRRPSAEEKHMPMSGESLLVVLLVGLIAGWLAAKIVTGGGLGIIGDLVVGILGAFIAAWLLPKLGVRLGTGIVRQIIDATLGAVILLALVRLVRRL